ncbi:MAG: hypothetical protein J7497_16040, partial [Chitinophagaceae bacterium]|nr:hypothetical protein [Chitinophagaceae bacterium]
NYTELPTPVVDNHMIAAIKKDNGDFIFLDGTDSHCIFGVPPHSIQDKEALVSISENEYKVVRVPVVPKEKNKLTDSTFIRLTDKGIEGDIKLTLEGYFATDTRSDMQYVAEKDNEKYMRNLMMRGSNKFMLNKYGSVNTSDIAHIAITGTFSLDDYARKIGNEWFINMNLMKPYEHQEIDFPKRKMPVEFDFRFIKKYVTVLEIPAGFKVSYLPGDKSYNNKVWGFSMKYTQSGNKLFLTQEFYNDHLLLQPGDFEAWNDVLKNLFPLYKETITLSGK